MSVEFELGLGNDMTAELVTLLNAAIGSSGIMEFFDGTKPAACADADAGTSLCTCALDSTPTQYGSGIDWSFNTITPTTVVADGTAQYWRVKNGSTVIMQGTCGTGSENIVFNNVGWTIGGSVTVNSITCQNVLTGN